MHSEGYSSCPMCVSVSLRHSSGTHATKLQTRHSTPMDQVSCSLRTLFGVIALLLNLRSQSTISFEMGYSAYFVYYARDFTHAVFYTNMYSRTAH